MSAARPDLSEILTTQYGTGLVLNVESIHVPKTAGTAFRHVLQHWYGPDLALWYNGDLETLVAPQTTVMHGHFRAGQHSATKRVMWVRDPIARTMSDFFHKRTYAPGPGVDQVYLDVHAGRMSFEEFAHESSTPNYLTQWYLGGLDLDDFAFVGISENMNAELQRVANILGKPAVSIDRSINRNDNAEYQAFRASLPASLVRELRQLNQDDIDFYRRALERSRSDAQRMPLAS